MQTVIKSAALALCLLAPLQGHAQDDRAARLVVAKDYVSRALADLDMSKVIRQMWQPMVPQIERATGKTLNEDQLTKINTLYQETFSSKMLDIMTAQDEIMADLLTLPELEALRDFYASENGRLVMLKLPDILAKQQPQILALVQGTMPTIMPKLKEIVEAQ